MSFTKVANYGSDFNPFVCPSTYQKDGVHWRDINALGLTVTCRFLGTNELFSANVIFDSSQDWYTGTGDANDGFANLCIPSCQADAWSLASHEFGHATGFDGPFEDGHFDPNATICENNSSQHTMCPFYHRGSERWRTLEPHDQHTFANAY